MSDPHAIKDNLLAVTLPPTAVVWFNDVDCNRVIAYAELSGGVDTDPDTYQRFLADLLIGHRFSGLHSVNVLRHRIRERFPTATVALANADYVLGIVDTVVVDSRIYSRRNGEITWDRLTKTTR